MGTPNKPDINIQFYDTEWHELISKSARFEIRDAGLLKIPTATVDLLNPSLIPNLYNRFRIFADVRGVSDMPFYGRINEIERIPIAGTFTKFGLRLHAYGLEQRLKNDYITYKYAKQQASREPETIWTFKSMIEDFIVLPDSGYDTNLTLDSDNGSDINEKVYGDFDPEQESLLDVFRCIAETLGYDGYVWIDGTDAKIKFWKLGTLATSPATTIQDPFIGRAKLRESLDDIANYILVWGGVETGFPWGEDTFTERGYAKYTPKIWEGVNGETVSDHQYGEEEAKPLKGDETQNSLYCIETNQIGTSLVRLRLRIDNTPMTKLDCAERYTSIDFYLKVKRSGYHRYRVRIVLTDNADNFIQYKIFEKTSEQVVWENFHIPLPRSKEDIDTTVKYDAWYDYQDIDLTNIVKVDIYVEVDEYSTGIMVDWFQFCGGLKIDPFDRPLLNPPVKDDTSISNYGVRVYNHYNPTLKSFEQAQYEGERVLAVLKDPIKTVTCTKKGYSWLRPNQTVTLNSSTLGISSETWRTTELIWNWASTRKILYCTMVLVPQYAKTPPVFGYTGQIPAVTTTPTPSVPQPRAPPWI